jgi:hypothetical protein
MTDFTVASPQAGAPAPRYTGRNNADAAPDTTRYTIVSYEGTGVIWADGCVGSSLCRLATRRPHPLALGPNNPGRAHKT